MVIEGASSLYIVLHGISLSGLDNDEDVLIALERTLENDGYTTTTALNHEEASKLLTQDTFDLLVLDNCLSDRDSIQVLTELRRAGLAPLVIVTYHRFPLPHQQEQLRALRVSALVNKRAHTELAHIVDHLLQPISKHRGSFEELT
jgi:CheY-like chemotaxis protein